MAGVQSAAPLQSSPRYGSATASNTAARGVHDVEVLDVARAHVRKAQFPTSGALGLSGTVAAIKLSLASVGVWWLLFSIPLFRHVPEPRIRLGALDGHGGPAWRAPFAAACSSAAF